MKSWFPLNKTYVKFPACPNENFNDSEEIITEIEMTFPYGQNLSGAKFQHLSVECRIFLDNRSSQFCRTLQIPSMRGQVSFKILPTVRHTFGNSARRISSLDK
ncbi:MAG: hypothetical protein CMJ81_09875 [Planctomycetaceae bacterium]|nr:hypothetical protein [Planctomycetaceae bacterium]MBP61651.1 hypothetical protein [Planctomycetaceae bacterium]